MHPIAVAHKLERIVNYLSKIGCKKIMLFGSYAEAVDIEIGLVDELVCNSGDIYSIIP